MTTRATRTQTDIEALRTDLRAMLAQVDRLLANHARPVSTADAPTRPADPLAHLPALISVEKAARILGLSRAAAYRLAATGELPARRLGGRVYIVTARLHELLEPDTQTPQEGSAA